MDISKSKCLNLHNIVIYRRLLYNIAIFLLFVSWQLGRPIMSLVHFKSYYSLFDFVGTHLIILIVRVLSCKTLFIILESEIFTICLQITKLFVVVLHQFISIYGEIIILSYETDFVHWILNFLWFYSIKTMWTVNMC